MKPTDIGPSFGSVATARCRVLGHRYVQQIFHHNGASDPFYICIRCGRSADHFVRGRQFIPPHG